MLVVTAHICRSLAPHLLSPAMSEKLPPMLFQLPFIRCLVMGRASVAGFALLSGFVNSLKPIKQSRAGSFDAALSGVAKTAFRRTGRFVIPAVIATSLSWLVCQFGAYKMAGEVDSQWIRDTSPAPSSSFAEAVYDLFDSLGRTWLDGYNAYDKIQWTLTFLLKGSMMTYLTLFATIYVKPRWRMFILCGLYYFKWKSGDGKCLHPACTRSGSLAADTGGSAGGLQRVHGHAARRHFFGHRLPGVGSGAPLYPHHRFRIGHPPRPVLLFISRGAP